LVPLGKARVAAGVRPWRLSLDRCRLVSAPGRFIGNGEANRAANGLNCMTQPTTNARMATTAIAAALAMSATPLIAQTVPPPDTTTATPPAPTVTTTDPRAPDPAATD